MSLNNCLSIYDLRGEAPGKPCTSLAEILAKGGNYTNSRDFPSLYQMLTASISSFTDDQMFRFLEDIKNLQDDFVKCRVIHDAAAALGACFGADEYMRMYESQIHANFPFPMGYTGQPDIPVTEVDLDTATDSDLAEAYRLANSMFQPFSYHGSIVHTLVGDGVVTYDTIFIKGRQGSDILRLIHKCGRNWVGVATWGNSTEICTKILDMLSEIPRA